MIIKSIAALKFIYWPGKNKDQFSVAACSGWVRRRLRAREGGVYSFALNIQLEKGEAEALLLDGQKQELLRLNEQQTAGEIVLNEKERYYLRWDFQRTSGQGRLSWSKN